MPDISLGHIGLKQETEFGEESDSQYALDSFISETVMLENDFVVPNYINKMRFNTTAVTGRVRVYGGVEMYAKPEGVLPWVLKGLFGAVETEQLAEGVYSHRFTTLHAASLPSYTMLIENHATSQEWLGTSMNGVVLTTKGNELTTLSLEALGQRPGATTDPPEVAIPAIIPFSGAWTTVELDGETCDTFEEINIDIGNNIETVFTMNRQRYCRAHAPGKITVGGRMTLEFETERERQRLWGAISAPGPQDTVRPCSLRVVSSHPVEIAPGHNYSMIVEMPEIYFVTAPANISRQSVRVLQTIEFFPVYNKASGRFADITIINGVPGYPSPD